MKTIKYKGNEYSCPTSYDEVTVRMQMQAEAIETNQKYVKTLGMLSAYTGIDIQLLKEGNADELVQLFKHIEFINEPLSTEPLFQFEFKGNTYNVSQTLVQQQFQDFVAAQTAIAEYNNNNWKLLTYLLAIMAKRDGETLDNFDINERAMHFEMIDVNTCNRIAAFFLSNQKISNLITLLSSPQVQRDIVLGKLKELKNSLESLRKQRGGKWYIKLQIGLILMWIKYYNRQLVKYYNTIV